MMRKLADKVIMGICALGFCGSLYVGSPAVLQVYNDRTQKEMLPKDGLSELLNKEAKEAGVPKGTLIKLNSIPNSSAQEPRTYYDSKYPNVYIMVMREENLNLHTLRHELYHIAAGHLVNGEATKNKAWLQAKRLFWYEPTATFYETWKLKI